MSTATQRLRNVLWGMLGGVAGGVLVLLALRHGQMNAWLFLSAVAAGGLGGLLAPVRRAPELYWSGLLEWCFAGNHAGMRNAP